jgi:hypothetical protein
MRLITRLSVILLSTALFVTPVAADTVKGSASATVAIKANVDASGQAHAAAADALYAKGEFEAALVAYGEGFAATRDAAFVYAMAECHKALGHKAEAKAMFEMYLAASGGAALEYESQAKAELGIAAEGAKGAVGKVTGTVKKTAKKAVFTVKGGIYSAVELSVAAKMKASAKAEAEAADAAYASKKYAEAGQGYLAAYAKSQQTIALYAAAQAHAQAGNAVEARALLLGYLQSKPKAYAAESKQLLLALGGSASGTVKVSVKAKVSAKAKADAGKGDKAFKAGQYATAVKMYASAQAKASSDAALLFAKGMAEYYAGMVAEARTSLEAYLAAGGKLEFEAQAQATLKASGSAK